MKIRITLFCGIILTLCMWLLLHHSSELKPTDSTKVAATTTNQQSVSQLPQPNDFENVSNPSAPTIATPPTVSNMNAEIDSRRKQFIMAWQTPIEFYGKVIDENSNAVAGASVQFGWMETPAKDGERKATTESDSDGLFSLQDERGPTLDVTVNKTGYYNSRKDKTGYKYGLGGDIFSPSMLNPVIFHLRKKEKGEPLIHIGGIGLHSMRDYLLAADGKPTDISLLTGNQTPVGQGDLQVEFQAGPPLDNFPSRISWSCSVAVPGGGLIETGEEFPFLAPENGYQASDKWNIVVTNWTQTINKQYYVKLRDGDFGRVNIRVIGTSSPFFRLDSYVNPSGSQVLESAQ